MGNLPIDPSSFSYSTHTWRVCRVAGTLLSEVDGTQAHFRVMPDLTNADLGSYRMRALHKEVLVDVLAVLEPGKVLGLRVAEPVVLI